MTVTLRPLTESDFPLMARWLSDPRVLEWYHGRDRPFDLAAVFEHYVPCVRGEDGMVASVIEADGRAVGYLQSYPVGRSAAEYGLEDGAGVWAADMFLGEPELWGRGLGPAAMRLAIDYAFAHRGATGLVIDPRVENVRAIRAYEKAGFRKVRVLPAHEEHEGALRDAWLMELAKLP